MEKLLHIFGGMAILYLIYVLGIKNWDYASEAKRLKIKEDIKQEGLSTSFYFITPKRLLFFEILSGGLFIFYWAYKQWQSMLRGYKNTTGKRLLFGPFLRSLFIAISMYQLTAILNRTCVYMRKEPAFPPFVWGTALWGGAVAACLPMLASGWRVLGAAFCLLSPYVLQNHINSLPKELPPSRIKAMEIVFLLFSWCVWGAAVFAYGKYVLGK
ncbi:MAG: hypothetical protein IKN49_01755 [Elusimicrobiaceae bacterium]|nr:hypothetical protein [Elusimicrobiaceae bacterium]